MAEPAIQKTPTTSYFDERDVPDMGDPSFIDTQVRAMFDEARRIMFERESPGAHVTELVDKWTKEFSPLNTAYVQSMRANSLSLFLRARGLGSHDPEEDTDAPVKALVAKTLERFVDASMAYHEEKITDEQLAFEIDTAAEDFTYLIRGLDNPAD